MKYNKVYFPKDAIARHEDFDAWYEDGDLFLSFKGKWDAEKDKIAVIGRMGGEIGHIRPDNKTLCYYLRLERWEFVLHTYEIFRHYYLEGMFWDLYGSMQNPPCDFVTTNNKKKERVKEAHYKIVDFRDKGECYEVSVTDVAKLRHAAITAVAILIKEEWRGYSEGEEIPNPSWVDWIKGNIFTKKLTPEQVEEEAERRRVRESLIKMNREDGK